MSISSTCVTSGTDAMHIGITHHNLGCKTKADSTAFSFKWCSFHCKTGVSPIADTRLPFLSFCTYTSQFQVVLHHVHVCSHFSRKLFAPFFRLAPCPTFQDTLQALNDEELERFIRWLNMEKELRIVNPSRQAERSHQQGTSARQCLHACHYCSRPCIFHSYTASQSDGHDHTGWHRCNLHWHRKG